MSDRPSPSPVPEAASPEKDAADAGAAARPESRPVEEKSVSERADDEAATLGDFA